MGFGSLRVLSGLSTVFQGYQRLSGCPQSFKVIGGHLRFSLSLSGSEVAVRFSMVPSRSPSFS